MELELTEILKRCNMLYTRWTVIALMNVEKFVYCGILHPKNEIYEKFTAVYFGSFLFGDR